MNIFILMGSILASLILGYAITVLIVSIAVRKSNDSGNSTGSISDYTKDCPLSIIESRDRVSLPAQLSVLKNFLKEK